MVKNNLTALLGYIFLRVLTFFSNFVIGFNSSRIESEQDLINRRNFEEIKMWITFILVLILYCIFAKYILKDQGSKIKNLLSVSLIFIVGLILCIGLALGYHSFESLYFLYTSVFSPIFPIYIKEGGLLAQLPYAIIPCILMGISIKRVE